VRIAPKGCGR
jgi:hypothetical protein